LHAYEREQISGLEVSRLLGGVRLKHLEAIGGELLAA
jgi:hypothetical protein